MSFSNEKLKIIIRKNAILIAPSIRLNKTEGRTGCRYDFTVVHVRMYQAGWDAAGTAVTPSTVLEAGAWLEIAGAGEGAQPAPMNNALVSRSGNATKSRMLKK